MREESRIERRGPSLWLEVTFGTRRRYEDQLGRRALPEVFILDDHDQRILVDLG